MKASLISILLIAAAIVGWQLTTLSSETTATATNEAPGSPVITRKTPQTLTSAVPSTSNAAESAQSFNTGEPEVELVQGIYVRKDRNCTVEVEERFDPDTGDLHKLYSCTPISPPEPDPYSFYDTDVLAAMAYGDAHAAEVLGVRLLHSEDPEVEAAGLNYLLRSAALGNHTRPIALAVNNRYNHFSTNGKLHLDSIKRLVTLSQISNAILPGSMSGATYQKVLRNNGVSEEEIAALVAAGNRALEKMAWIQTQVTGNTDLQEVLDDA